MGEEMPLVCCDADQLISADFGGLLVVRLTEDQRHGLACDRERNTRIYSEAFKCVGQMEGGNVTNVELREGFALVWRVPADRIRKVVP